MKKTVHIDDRLLAEAKAACQARTDTDAIRLGLEALVRHAISEGKGGVEVKISLRAADGRAGNRTWTSFSSSRRAEQALRAQGRISPKDFLAPYLNEISRAVGVQ